MSAYEDLPLLPDDPIFKIPRLYKADPRQERINLGLGTYRNGFGIPYVFEAVRKAEAHLLEELLDKEYLPMQGDLDYCRLATELVFGAMTPHAENRIVAVQTIGASGALRLGGEFLRRRGVDMIAIGEPSWPNHLPIFSQMFDTIMTFPYCLGIKGELAFDAMVQALELLPPGCAVVMQACCHNPSGSDPTLAQWQELCELFCRRRLIPFFDVAYQGYGIDFLQDSLALKRFCETELEPIVAVSFSKNFGLYGERVGLLAAILNDVRVGDAVISQLKSLARMAYSSPPMHGSSIIKVILQDPALRTLWENELARCRQRIDIMRQRLKELLEERTSIGLWQALGQGHGFFAFSGLTADQVVYLQREWALYLPENGRINLAGLNDSNIVRTAAAISAALDYS